MRDEEYAQLAKNIGENLDMDGMIKIANAFMIKNGLADLNFEMIPPTTGQNNPKWQIKYSYRKWKIATEEEDGAE